MSTYFNEETKAYENFENAVIKALAMIDGAMHSGVTEEPVPETPVDDGPIEVEIPEPPEGENGET